MEEEEVRGKARQDKRWQQVGESERANTCSPTGGGDAGAQFTALARVCMTGAI